MMPLPIEISIISLLISSIIVFWFAVLAVIEKKNKWPFLPFLLQFSMTCFIAAGLFTDMNFRLLDVFVYGLSIIIGATYIVILWRQNGIVG